MTPLDLFNLARESGRNTPMSDTMEILNMIRDGDVHHIDGDLITAMNLLASGESADYAGATIHPPSVSTDGRFCLVRGRLSCFEDTALSAMIEAQRTAHPVMSLDKMPGWSVA